MRPAVYDEYVLRVAATTSIISADGTQTQTLTTGCQISGSAGLVTAELGASSGSSTSGSTAAFDDLEACP
jgi:hypothetical protein